MSRRVFYCLLLTVCCLLLSGCRQDMQDQPRYEPYEASGFFSDGLSSRRPVEGTVPRGYLRADRQLYTGKMAAGAQANANANAGGGAGAEAGAQANANAQGGAGGGSQPQGNAQGNANAAQGGGASSQGGAVQNAPAGEADDADTFPFPVTEDVVKRGKERYEIFCSMCHGPTGDGDGMIVRRGYRRPPSYHEDRLRQARVGYFFRVMTEGFGAMPPYRSQVPVQDRWAIAAYIRALQLSQSNLRDAPAAAAPPAGGQNQTGGHE
ncbi:MAG TPA: cytochrome c [Pyrinomonadaceae bacterium]|nr:cytochrome c [Pyrinomonadaceae bacterium]